MKKLVTILCSIAIALAAITFFAVPARADIVMDPSMTTTSSPAPTTTAAPATEPETEATEQTTSNATASTKENEPTEVQKPLILVGVIVGAVVVAVIASVVLFKE